MNTTDNDYMPIDESEEYSLIEEREEEEEEESVNPDVERYSFLPKSFNSCSKIQVNCLCMLMDTSIIQSGNSLKIHRLLKSGPQPFFSQQGVKKIIVTACHSCKLKLPFTSPDVISNSPKNFLTSRIDFTVLLYYLNSSKKPLACRTS